MMVNSSLRNGTFIVEGFNISANVTSFDVKTFSFTNYSIGLAACTIVGCSTYSVKNFTTLATGNFHCFHKNVTTSYKVSLESKRN